MYVGTYVRMYVRMCVCVCVIYIYICIIHRMCTDNHASGSFGVGIGLGPWLPLASKARLTLAEGTSLALGDATAHGLLLTVPREGAWSEGSCDQ